MNEQYRNAFYQNNSELPEQQFQYAAKYCPFCQMSYAGEMQYCTCCGRPLAPMQPYASPRNYYAIVSMVLGIIGIVITCFTILGAVFVGIVRSFIPGSSGSNPSLQDLAFAIPGMAAVVLGIIGIRIFLKAKERQGVIESIVGMGLGVGNILYFMLPLLNTLFYELQFAL